MKRKITALALALTIIFTFAGCGADELGFYNTIRNIFNLQDYAFEGTLSANIKTLDYINPNPTNTQKTEKVQAQIDNLKQACTNSIVYDGVISVVNNKVSFNAGLKDSTGKVTNVVKLLAIDKTLYISKDAITSVLPNGTFVYETPLNDGVEYAKFTFTDLANMYLESLRESMLSYPNVYSTFSDNTKSADYSNGYNTGYYDGADDGFVNDTTQPSYSLANDANVIDPINGKEDYDTAYPLGYAQGFEDAKAQKVIDEASFAKISSETLSFASSLSVSSILKSRQSITTKIMDQIINNFCKDLSVDLVKKDGDNKYTMCVSHNVRKISLDK